MRPVTPRGFRDVLFAEAAERRWVAGAIGEAFMRYGYEFVETPVLEEYRTLEAVAGSSLEGTAFRMVDLDGSLLALRPEMTLPIARLAASRLGRRAGSAPGLLRGGGVPRARVAARRGAAVHPGRCGAARQRWRRLRRRSGGRSRRRPRGDWPARVHGGRRYGGRSAFAARMRAAAPGSGRPTSWRRRTTATWSRWTA